MLIACVYVLSLEIGFLLFSIYKLLFYPERTKGNKFLTMGKLLTYSIRNLQELHCIIL